MDKREAAALLETELESWRQLPYADLADLIGRESATREVGGGTKDRYQLVIEVFWDAKPGGALRVLGAIDDGGLRAFVPLTDSFIMAPDGSFVGEDSA